MLRECRGRRHEGCLRSGESQAEKERELSTLRNMIKGALALGVALLVGAAAAGAAAASVSNPAVEGPIEKGIRGHAWNHSVFRSRRRATAIRRTSTSTA